MSGDRQPVTSRRALLTGGCAAAAALIAPATAHALRLRPPAPRVSCPHEGCRHHRPDAPGPGLCAFSLRAEAAYRGDAHPPSEEAP